MTDTEMIGLLKSSPQRGLAAVVERYGAYVYKIAYTKLGDVCSEEDIEETVSDIFLRFFRSAESAGFEMRSVRGYLSVVAQRHCIDVFRRRRTQPETVSFEEIEDTIADSGTEQDTELYEALQALGEPDTTIFIRKYYFGQKTADIAREMNIRPNTVDKHLSRGLVRLRKILKKGEG